MIIHVGGDNYWEVTQPKNNIGVSKALLRSSRTCNTKRSMTVDLSGYSEWLYENIETVEGNTDAQNKIIFFMQKWGLYNHRIEREGKIIFS